MRKAVSGRRGHRVAVDLPSRQRLRDMYVFSNAQTRVSDCGMLQCVGSSIASTGVTGVRWGEW
jgi:hypothetical protein